MLQQDKLDTPRLHVIVELLGAKLDLAKSLDEEIIEVCNVDEIGAESELAEEMNLRVLSKIRAVKDATSQDSSDKIKTTHGHETSPFTLQASTLQQPVDSENEQTLTPPLHYKHLLFNNLWI